MLDILQKIGLTPTESKVYIALLELGESKTGDILEKAGINSGRIYEILASLQKKGLISSIVKGKIRHFIPSSPERVDDYINEQIDALNREKDDFQKVLPQLNKKFHQLKQKTNVEVFYGMKGLRTAYDLLLKESAHDKKLYVYGVSAPEKYYKEIVDFMRYYVYKKRKDAGLKTFKIISEEARRFDTWKIDTSLIKYIPFATITCIQLLGNVTLITYEKEPIISIVITDKGIAQDYRRQFEFLWKKAKR